MGPVQFRIDSGQEEDERSLAGGRRFVLAALGNWQGFEIGNDDDFGKEVERTVENKELMQFLAQRREKGKNIPLAEVEARHGLT